MNFCVALATILCYITRRGLSGFSESYPHFNTTDDSDVENFSTQMLAQAISSVMAATATKMMINEDAASVESCTQTAQDLSEYAQCLEPLWNHAELHDRAKKSIESAQWSQMNDENQRSMKKVAAAAPRAKSPIGHVADFFTSLFAKPKIEKYKKPASDDSNIMAGTLVESFVHKLFEPVDGLIDAIHSDDEENDDEPLTIKNKMADFVEKMKKSENFQRLMSTRPKNQLELLENIQQLVSNLTRETPSSVKNDENAFILSPRFFPVSRPEKGRRLLSPDIFSFDHDSTKKKSIIDAENIAPMDKLFDAALVEGDRRSLKRFIMRLSGAEEKLKKKTTMRASISKNDKKLNNAFRRLYESVHADQVDELARNGYAFLTKKQMQIFYGGKRPIVDSYYGNATLRSQMHKIVDKRDALVRYFKSAANGEGLRSKRAVIGNASVLAPFILAPQAANPIILHPLVLSPLVLSPSVLGPLILSPALFSPLVLSPSVLGGAVLSPLVGDALVLSPLVLFPIILSPLLLSPLILSPLLLTPIVLSPLVLSPVILSPLVLSPVVLSPVVLSPLVLSPGLLSPLVHSPVASGVKMLSPELMSPSVHSPKTNYTVVMSPSILSKK
uniref:Uncharacterized protein n=1 Tax=Romanomermis culicivorax TaxID=13658 RepID=A0A915KEC7_ROMCU